MRFPSSFAFLNPGLQRNGANELRAENMSRKQQFPFERANLGYFLTGGGS